MAWLAVRYSQTSVAELMHIAWRSVGGICARVAADARTGRDLMAGVRRIGIDEISHRSRPGAPSLTSASLVPTLLS